MINDNRGSTTVWLGFFTVVIVVVALVFSLAVLNPGAADDVTGDTPSEADPGTSSEDETRSEQSTDTRDDNGSPDQDTDSGDDSTSDTRDGSGTDNGTDEDTEDSTETGTDSDNDGLTNTEENQLGTDPHNADTDGDGLLDGWEVHGVRFPDRCNGEIPLDEYGADPLHKDLFLELRHRGSGITESEYRNLVAVYDNAPVDNPDGRQGINFHLDADTGFADLRGDGVSYGEGFEESCRFGVFYFGDVNEGKDHASADVDGYEVEYYSGSLEELREQGSPVYNLFLHELGHNTLGRLDEGNSADDSSTHSRYCESPSGFGDDPEPRDSGVMCDTLRDYYRTYHDDVWREISRDGLQGLPDVPRSRWELGDRD